ncbi:uncharacterized protein LOC135943604 [Cloeon dipterum]|uniref:uncharacterized protein LOC135943604 n=1 Tax=Cloeon dipterum TaxID=197152 RepID=UPI00321FF730
MPPPTMPPPTMPPPTMPPPTSPPPTSPPPTSPPPTSPPPTMPPPTSPPPTSPPPTSPPRPPPTPPPPTPPPPTPPPPTPPPPTSPPLQSPPPPPLTAPSAATAITSRYEFVGDALDSCSAASDLVPSLICSVHLQGLPVRLRCSCSSFSPPVLHLQAGPVPRVLQVLQIQIHSGLWESSSFYSFSPTSSSSSQIDSNNHKNYNKLE